VIGKKKFILCVALYGDVLPPLNVPQKLAAYMNLECVGAVGYQNLESANDRNLMSFFLKK